MILPLDRFDLSANSFLHLTPSIGKERPTSKTSKSNQIRRRLRNLTFKNFSISRISKAAAATDASHKSCRGQNLRNLKRSATFLKIFKRPNIKFEKVKGMQDMPTHAHSIVKAVFDLKKTVAFKEAWDQRSKPF